MSPLNDSSEIFDARNIRFYSQTKPSVPRRGFPRAGDPFLLQAITPEQVASFT